MLPEESRTNIRLGRIEEPPAVASGVEEMVTVAAAAGCAASETRPAAINRAMRVLRVVFIFPVLPWRRLLGADEHLDDGDRVARSHRLGSDAVVRRRRPGEVVGGAGVHAFAGDCRVVG